jgi:hypothetical protein
LLILKSRDAILLLMWTKHKLSIFCTIIILVQSLEDE